MDYDFLNNQDLSEFGETPAQQQGIDDSNEPEVKQPIGVPAGNQQVVENTQDDDGDQDWDDFLNQSQENQISEEDKAQLEMIEKTTGRKFDTIQEFKEFINKPEAQQQEQKQQEVDQVELNNANIGKIDTLLAKSEDDLIKFDILRLDPNADPEDIELEIEQMKDNGIFRSKVREVRSFLNSHRNQLEQNNKTIEEQKEKEIENKRTENRNKLKETIKSHDKLFGVIPVPEQIQKDVYRSIVSGDLDRQIKESHESIAELATLLALKPQIIEAVKKAAQGGYAFENGKYAILKNMSNVKPRQSSGSPLENLFEDKQNEVTFDEIIASTMNFIDSSDDKK